MHAKHEPWQLENANARIDNIRKGTTNLTFTFANGKKLPSDANLNLELQSHDFKFGVSMTQARGFFGTDAFQPYLDATKSCLLVSFLELKPNLLKVIHDNLYLPIKLCQVLSHIIHFQEHHQVKL